MAGNEKSPDNYKVEDFVTDESFINYFFQLNSDDKAFWEKWLIAHPYNNEPFEAAKEMLRNLSLTLSDEEYDVEMAKIMKAINYDAPVQVRKVPIVTRLLHWGNPSRIKNKRSGYIKYLLPVLLIFIAVGYFLLKHFVIQPGSMLEKFNESSNPVVFSLSDGSVVTLAPQSGLRYPADFKDKNRNVYLNGEAQFHVMRDTLHPFKVHEGDIVATVLGTVFNVKKQSGDSVMVVELIQGKLSVETVNSAGFPAQSVILYPDERVIYNHYSQKFYKEQWQQQKNLSLQVNHITFKRNNFDQIAERIQEVFGVTLINKSKKKDWLFSGEFDNVSAKEITEHICLVEGLNSEAVGDTIIIK